MLKQLTIAAFSIATLTIAPLPIVTGTALAQPCTAGANYCPPAKGTGSTYECSNELGFLRRVYEEELDGIENPDLVSVIPVCLGEDYGLMRSDGNAGALRRTVAENDAMAWALHLQNFGPDDVVGIRMTGDDSVILYVHPFLH